MTNDHRVMGADNTSGSGAVGLAMLPNVHRIIGTCHFVLTLSQQRYGWALAHIGSHLAGSLLMTFAGIWTVRWIVA